MKLIELEKFDFKIAEPRLNSYINKMAKNDLKKLKNDFKSFGVDFIMEKKLKQNFGNNLYILNTQKKLI